MTTTSEPTHSATGATPPVGAASSPRIAYLLSRYPAISHTFFLHEVLGLRALGITIETASINAPDRLLEALPPIEAEESRKTFYIKAGPKADAAFKLLRIAVTNPEVLLRGLEAVAKVPDLTLQKRSLWLAYLAEALLVGDWMQQRSLKHLHVHFGGAVASVGYLTSIAWQIPYSLTIHGPEELQDFSAYQMREKVEQAAFVLCISHFARSQLMQRVAPAYWSKLEVSRLGITEEFLSQPYTRTQNQAPHVVCVGRLVPEKGQRLLIEAIARLRAKSSEITATLVGGGAEYDSLERYARTHGLNDVIHFAGPQSHPETLAILRTADIFVLPSFAEGIPVALMEAMALEIPCISTTVAGISELIRHGQDGLLVAPADLDALTDALALLASDVKLRERMGASSRERVLSTYRLRDNHQRLAAIFRARVPSATGAVRV